MLHLTLYITYNLFDNYLLINVFGPMCNKMLVLNDSGRNFHLMQAHVFELCLNACGV